MSDISTVLPEEIVDEILLRLPIKDLVRCSAVCKPWSSLLKSSAFISNHLRRRHSATHPNDDDHHLLLLCGEPPYALHKDNQELDEHAKLKSPFLAHNKTSSSKVLHDDNGYVIGTCNGLVCLVADDEDFTTILIWNPSIRKFVVLPNPMAKVTKIKGTSITCQASYAFGYDSSTDDYKVLRSSSTRGIEIWSLARGWKSLNPKVIPVNFSHELTFHDLHRRLHYSRSVLINGVLNWVQKCKKGGYTIGKFDMSSELFGEMTAPEDLPDESKFYGYQNTSYFISRYRESIALFQTRLCSGWPFRNDDFNFWVMKEYNVAGSWIKLSVSLSSTHTRRQPYFRKNGELILISSIGALLVDIESKQRKRISDIGWYTNFIDSFVESLVLFGHPNVISY